jgi:predicted MFS family arabinose efflux permease
VGFFVGGAVGGTIAKDVGSPGLFAACAVLMVVWLVAAWPMKPPPPRRSPQEVLADEADARVT